MRQSIRGYTDAVLEQVTAGGGLATTAAELVAVRDLLAGSDDLRRNLADSGVPVPARRAVLTELLQSKVGAPTLRLITFCVAADRASEFVDDVAWLAVRIDAAAHQLEPVGEATLGHKAAEERLDGYATALLEDLSGSGPIGEVEDELFRFLRILGGADDLRAVLTSRDEPAARRRALVVDLLHGRASAPTVALAAYATRIGRPRDYEALVAFLVDRVASESNRRLAEVRTAVELDDGQRRHLEAALSGVAGRNVEVRLTIDPSVLGGFVATMGDTVVDGSVRHRLDILKERLVLPEANITRGGSADG